MGEGPERGCVKIGTEQKNLKALVSFLAFSEEVVTQDIVSLQPIWDLLDFSTAL